MAATRTLVVQIIGDPSSAQRAFAQTAAAAGTLESKLTSAGKRMSAVGRTLTTHVSLPLVATGVASTKMAVDFEKSLEQVRNLVGASQRQIDTWRQQLLDLSHETAQSPQDLAEALYFVASSGVKTSQVMRVLSASAKASAVGLGDTKTVADAVTSAMNAYGPATLRANRATEILLQTVKYGKGEPDELAAAIGRVIPVAAKLKVPFADVGASLAGLTLQGLDAAEATTSLRAIFTTLLKPSKGAEGLLKGVGLSAAELRDVLAKRGTLAMLQLLSDRFKGNEEAMAGVFPNVRALVGAFNLTGGSAKRNSQIFADMQEKTDDLGKGFRDVSHSQAFQLEQALNDIRIAGIKIGEELLPALAKLAPTIEDLVTAASHVPPWVFGVGLAAGPVLRMGGAILKLGGWALKAARWMGLLTAAENANALAAGRAAAANESLATTGIGRDIAALGGGGAAAEAGAGAGAVGLGGLALTAAPLVAIAGAMKAIDATGLLDSGGAVSHTPLGSLLGISSHSTREQGKALVGLASAAARAQQHMDDLGRKTPQDVHDISHALKQARDAGLDVENTYGDVFQHIRDGYGRLSIAALSASDKQKRAWVQQAQLAVRNGDMTRGQLDRLIDAFNKTGSHFRDTRLSMRETWQLIAQDTDRNVSKVKADTGSLARKWIADMRNVKGTNADVLAAIADDTNRELRQFGVAEIKFSASSAAHGPFGGTRRQRGGPIAGYQMGDVVPALLEPGEFVVNREAVAAYGVDFLAAVNASVPRFARGGPVSFGGHPSNVSGAVRNMIATLQARFPLAVTSTTDGTHAAGSYHYRGQAVDLSADPQTMLRAAAWIRSSGAYRSLAEGIHNPNLSVSAGQFVSPSYWGSATWADHADHIHLALTGAFGPQAQRIARIMIQGPAGRYRDLLQANADRTRRAANRYIARMASRSAAESRAGVAGHGNFLSTAYGPPWGGIQGSGVTATGVNLLGSPHILGVAVDPSVIPLGSRLSISPNPFGTRRPFRAFDTGGAIKGRRIDFYDWRGRADQLGWGERMVNVRRLARGGPVAMQGGGLAGRIHHLRHHEHHVRERLRHIEHALEHADSRRERRRVRRLERRVQARADLTKELISELRQLRHDIREQNRLSREEQRVSHRAVMRTLSELVSDHLGARGLAKSRLASAGIGTVGRA